MSRAIPEHAMRFRETFRDDGNRELPRLLQCERLSVPRPVLHDNRNGRTPAGDTIENVQAERVVAVLGTLQQAPR